jgi:hypothetical protein
MVEAAVPTAVVLRALMVVITKMAIQAAEDHLVRAEFLAVLTALSVMVPLEVEAVSSRFPGQKR